MKHFPIYSIHDVFNNPYEIIEMADKLNYSKSPTGNFPGIRSSKLHSLYPEFWRKFMRSIFGLIWNLDIEKADSYEAHMYFHKMVPFSKNKKDIRNHGWIHRDNPAMIAGIVYLTPDADLDSGTSIYTPNSNVIFETDSIKTKEDLYNKDTYNAKKYKKEYEYSCSQFTQTTKINNVFNSMVMYGGDTWHKIDNFITGKKERLTLNWFLYNIKATSFPMERFR